MLLSDNKTPEPFLLQYFLLMFLLLFSFYFSGSETAIFSLNRLDRNSLKKTKSKKKRHILSSLLDHQEQLLITILTGNMVVNIFASNIGSTIGAHLFHGESELLSIVGMTLLLLLFGELTPKRIAVNHSRGFTSWIAVPLYYIHLFLGPVRYVLNIFTKLVLKMFPRSMGEIKEDKLALVLSTAELGYNQQILKQSEYRLFKSYLKFKGKKANGVMTPRSELRTISHDLSIAEVLATIASAPEYVINSSIILFMGDNDHLFGWVPVTDLLEYKFTKKDLRESISKLSRPFHTVPESKDLATLILELRETDMDIVLLVDEYGGTAGIVWFRNIIEDVLRAFYTPYQEFSDEDTEINQVIPGSMTIEEFEEIFGIDTNLDVETAAGLFLVKFGDIPLTGDEVFYQGIRIMALEMEGNKIMTLQVDLRRES